MIFFTYIVVDFFSGRFCRAQQINFDDFCLISSEVFVFTCIINNSSIQFYPITPVIIVNMISVYYRITLRLSNDLMLRANYLHMYLTIFEYWNSA